MLNRRWLISLIVALIGYSTAIILFPRVEPAARWNFTLDRDTAIKKAREAATRIGVDTTGWKPFVSSSYNHATEYYLGRYPNSLGSGFLFPVRVSVKLLDTRTGRDLRMALNSRGGMIGFRQSDPRRSAPTGSEPDQSQDSSGQSDENLSRDKLLAEDAIKNIVGSEWNRFSLADSSQEKDGRRFTWVASDERIKLNFQTTVQAQSVKELSLETNLISQFKSEYDNRRGRAMRIYSNVDILILWPAIFAVIILYFVGLALKQIQHRVTVTFLIVILFFLLIYNILGSFADVLRADFNIGTSIPNYWVVSFLPWLIFGLIILVIAFFLYLCWAAGLAQAIKLPNRKTISLELLLKGKLFTKTVARSILAGLLAGGIFCAIPYLSAVSGLFPGVELNSEGYEDLFVSRLPALTTFLAPYHCLLFIVFAFLGPLADVFVKRPLIAQLLIFFSTLLCILSEEFVYVSASASLFISTLIATILTVVYYRFDLLAVMITCMAAQTAFGSAGLLSQGSESLRASGMVALAGLGITIFISLVGLWKAREVRAEEVAVPAGLFTSRAERERLKAEFSVAHRAQQQLLPNVMPQVDGLEIAAICHPSREVGGDLYDFIQMRDGRLGIVVADVSGKGVPASLYMTLTKGLLDSITEDKTDPGDILREVNRHLFEVCQRKVFVTLFLGVIDPVKKTLDYARAGHNPTVFRRSSEQKTMLLKSPGMGLGLNNGSVFDSSLKVATLQLESNDTLFFYSDGITEAMNGKNEDYGEERLMSIAASVDGARAEIARDLIMADVGKFLGPVHPQDDQTLVVVRVI